MSARMPTRRAEPKNVFSVRVRETVYDRAQKLCEGTGPFTPSLSQICDRGMELACEELERQKAATTT
jgi:hypothetical protein